MMNILSIFSEIKKGCAVKPDCFIKICHGSGFEPYDPELLNLIVVDDLWYQLQFKPDEIEKPEFIQDVIKMVNEQRRQHKNNSCNSPTFCGTM